MEGGLGEDLSNDAETHAENAATEMMRPASLWAGCVRNDTKRAETRSFRYPRLSLASSRQCPPPNLLSFV